MLDWFAPSVARPFKSHHTNMPLDFSSYLLPMSSSPPATALSRQLTCGHSMLRCKKTASAPELGTLRDALTSVYGHSFGSANDIQSLTKDFRTLSFDDSALPSYNHYNHHSDSAETSDNLFPFPLDEDLDDYDGDNGAPVFETPEDHEVTTITNGDVVQCKSINKQTGTKSKDASEKKHVSFADECGLQLTDVRVMRENSDSPPMLSIHRGLLTDLTAGAVAVPLAPRLQLQFSQPASEYVLFHEKLNKGNVSLENVILKDYDVIGTIKVRNIDFHKNVFVRVTFDGWESHHDFPARYVCSDGVGRLDTFKFEFSIPSDVDLPLGVEFAVCFESNSEQFWDNNKGDNYQILPFVETGFAHARSSYTKDFKPNFSEYDSFSDYGSWNHFSGENYYY